MPISSLLFDHFIIAFISLPLRPVLRHYMLAGVTPPMPRLYFDISRLRSSRFFDAIWLLRFHYHADAALS